MTDTKKPGDGTICNVLYPVRTTYAYRIDPNGIGLPDRAEPQLPMPNRPPGESGRQQRPDLARQAAQAERLRSMPPNRWVPLSDPGRVAPTRTWGSATFDSVRGQVLLWGGGHCGYGGSDVDAYDVAAHTWVSSSETPEYPHRLWDHGVRLAGVTFGGNPWTEHGRRIYAFDPISRQMIMVRTIRLTTVTKRPACASSPASRGRRPMRRSGHPRPTSSTSPGASTQSPVSGTCSARPPWVSTPL